MPRRTDTPERSPALDRLGPAEAMEVAFSGIDEEGGGDSDFCEAALAPFIRDLDRLMAMGLADPALAQLKGMVLGLHDLKGQLPAEAGTYCTSRGLRDVLAAWVHGRPAAADAAFLAWVGEVLPDWRGDVEPQLGHLRKSAGMPRRMG